MAKRDFHHPAPSRMGPESMAARLAGWALWKGGVVPRVQLFIDRRCSSRPGRMWRRNADSHVDGDGGWTACWLIPILFAEQSPDCHPIDKMASTDPS